MREHIPNRVGELIPIFDNIFQLAVRKQSWRYILLRGSRTHAYFSFAKNIELTTAPLLELGKAARSARDDNIMFGYLYDCEIVDKSINVVLRE